MSIVVDASVALKWVLQEPDSHVAEALIRLEPDLLIPDFWLAEATNVLWVQVRRKFLTPDEAREGLALLRALIRPTPTTDMNLHEVALDIGISVNHSTYDTLYLAFAVAMGARSIVVSDGPFVRDMRTQSRLVSIREHLESLESLVIQWLRAESREQLDVDDGQSWAL